MHTYIDAVEKSRTARCDKNTDSETRNYMNSETLEPTDIIS